MTQGRGVDIVLNSLAGHSLVASWECLAPYGRFIEIGKKYIQSNGKVPMLPFAMNVTFNAVDMTTIGDARPFHIRLILEIIVDLVAAGTIRPPQAVQEYQVSDIEQAFRHMQSGKNVGKVVVTFDKQDKVTVCASTRLPNPKYLYWLR